MQEVGLAGAVARVGDHHIVRLVGVAFGSDRELLLCVRARSREVREQPELPERRPEAEGDEVDVHKCRVNLHAAADRHIHRAVLAGAARIWTRVVGRHENEAVFHGAQVQRGIRRVAHGEETIARCRLVLPHFHCLIYSTDNIKNTLHVVTDLSVI